MPMVRPKVKLTLSDAEQSQLASMTRSRSIPAALVTRARIVLAAAAGEPNCRGDDDLCDQRPSILRTAGPPAHRSARFKLSTAPFFVEELRDVVRLYLSPPEKALVL
jgi:hypothetical protein